MSPVEKVVAALEAIDHRVNPRGGYHQAQCPAHLDRNPSLTITGAENGHALLHCHAGCSTEDVVAPLGLRTADLFAEGQASNVVPAAGPAEYVYTDAQGRPVGKVVRGAGKRFHQRRPVGEHWESGGCAELAETPYRLPEVLAAIAEGRPVYVTEGERDADTATSLGVAATCNAGGAGKWRPAHAQHLAGASVVIVRDRDQPGHDHAVKVAESLAGIAESVTIVEAKAGKDLTDHVHNGHGLDDLVDVPGPGDDPAAGMVDRYPPLDWAAVWEGTGDEPEWVVPGVFERGRSYALFSPAKAGKSLLMADIVASLVTGRELLGQPNLIGPGRVLYVDMENTTADLRQRFDAMGYGPDDLNGLTYLSFPSLPPLDAAEGGRHLAALANHYAPVLIVLDTVARVISGPENDADTFRAMYRHTLSELKAAGHTVVRLDHEGKDSTAGQRGSSAKADDVDAVWRLTRHGEVGVTLRCERQRSGNHPETIELTRKTDPVLRHVRDDLGELSVKVTRLVGELDRLMVTSDAGRTASRKALADAGVKARNDDLAEAIRVRRNRPTSWEKVSPNGWDSPSDVKIENSCPNPSGHPDVSAAQSCPGQVGDSGDSGPSVPQAAPVPNCPPLGSV